MTAADLLTELVLIAGVTSLWVALVLLMLERDRKRRGRYRVTETTTTGDRSDGHRHHHAPIICIRGGLALVVTKPEPGETRYVAHKPFCGAAA